MQKWGVGKAAVVMVLVVATLSVLFPRPPKATEETSRQVKEGMTVAQVRAILGPPGDYRTRPPAYPSTITGDRSRTVWLTDRGNVGVSFDAGVVTRVEFEGNEPESVGPLELARWRLGRTWARGNR